ncbi:endonuclease domain-containing protein [Nocardioides bruguierae]|uniref:Endonuclease domain-containing protein n=1 Tax=Nocardioides bruguierae TaxID=2945102 RepID=A0A9X2D689_9ACTN|nr:DUF559 domain-containing protein [Nocardioides bruguierae]MCM0619607.1 endonuclease domain-containing protein [Nocardioides bruguierae]
MVGRDGDIGTRVGGMHRWRFDDPVLARARALGEAQGGALGRRQAYSLGMPRWLIVREVKQGRWRRVTSQVVAVHCGPMTDDGHRWAAVLSGGPRAVLDGAASLQASGLERFRSPSVRVSVPRGARIRRTRAYDIRQTRRWAAGDVADAPGTPRTRPAVAAVRAGLWARTDKEASLVVTMAVQQSVARVEDVARELLRVRRDKRRLLLHALVNDLLDGVRSLGELDVARELRRRGLPEPSRQHLRRDSRGRYVLDLYWPELGLVVEIDGIHHQWAENVVADALRQNALALAGDTVLRLPLLGLRLAPDEFYDQIARAIADRRPLAA